VALLATVAENQGDDMADEYGPQGEGWRITSRRAALARAHYLGEQLRGAGAGELGDAGTKLVEWLGSVLEILDPAPPPPGSYMHLLLDRYAREAWMIENRLDAATERDDFARWAEELAMNEVEAVREVLHAMDVSAELDRFDSELGRILEPSPSPAPATPPRSTFWKIRAHVFRTLIGVSVDGYALSTSRVPDRLLQEMVEESSGAISAMLGR
jgi:hypothetical protein